MCDCDSNCFDSLPTDQLSSIFDQTDWGLCCWRQTYFLYPWDCERPLSTSLLLIQALNPLKHEHNMQCCDAHQEIRCEFKCVATNKNSNLFKAAAALVCSASTSNSVKKNIFILPPETALDLQLIRRKPQRQSSSLLCLQSGNQQSCWRGDVLPDSFHANKSSKSQRGNMWESIYWRSESNNLQSSQKTLKSLHNRSQFEWCFTGRGFLPAVLSLNTLSLQLPVWGLFKLISLRLPRGSI